MDEVELAAVHAAFKPGGVGYHEAARGGANELAPGVGGGAGGKGGGAGGVCWVESGEREKGAGGEAQGVLRQRLPLGHLKKEEEAVEGKKRGATILIKEQK